MSSVYLSLYKKKYHSNNLGSIFIFEKYRGQNLFEEIQERFQLRIVTIEECNLRSYLRNKGIPYSMQKHSEAYNIIQHHYKDKRAERSGVPLIYHIDEGLALLEHLGAAKNVKDAYALHPMIQSTKDFNNNYRINFSGVNSASLLLAAEYRHIANSYLSTGVKEDFAGFTNNDIKLMLIADKVQNYKDFLNYHNGVHSKSKRLNEYFSDWFKLLGVNYNTLAEELKIKRSKELIEIK